MPLPEHVDAFLATLDRQAPDSSWPDGLKALWYEGAGDWQAAHDIAEALEGPVGSWIHAYLHRREGDRWNAGYWYNRAGRPYPEHPMQEEYRELVAYLLQV